MTTIYILLWLFPIAVNIYTDRKGRKPIYIQTFIARGFAAILHGALFNPHNLLDYSPIFLFQITSFWLLFDLGLNIIRKRPLLYYDRKEGDSGWIERFFKENPTGYYILKFQALIVCILSIIILYVR